MCEEQIAAVDRILDAGAQRATRGLFRRLAADHGVLHDDLRRMIARRERDGRAESGPTGAASDPGGSSHTAADADAAQGVAAQGVARPVASLSQTERP